MEETDEGFAGIPASMRSFAQSVLGLLSTRIELLAVELQEEKLRTIRLLIWLSVALALAAAAILVALGVLALVLWHSAGYAGLIALAGVALIAAAGLFWFLRREITRGPEPFEATLSEFRKDVEWLRRED